MAEEQENSLLSIPSESSSMETINVLQDVDSEEDNEEIALEFEGLYDYIYRCFEDSKQARIHQEAIWLDAYRDYRGIPSPDVSHNAQGSENRSNVFVKIAKTKTLAAYGQLVEVVYSGGKFPIGIMSTEKPTGVAKNVHAKQPQEQSQNTPNVGYDGDGFNSASEALAGLESKYPNAEFELGPSNDPNVPQLNPAKEIARNMETTIHDQLTESQASREVRKSLFESCLYGTGILKGPFTQKKIQHKWEATSEDKEVEFEYQPKLTDTPKVKGVSCWNFYPDAAATCIEDCDYAIERHKLSKHQLRALRKQPYFNKNAIAMAIAKGSNYTRQGYESALTDGGNETTYETQSRWEVLEYWGIVDKEIAIMSGLEIPEELSELEELNVNVWICNGEILRLIINPFIPERIPYNAFPYEFNPNDFWGIGVPENMSDSTRIMNGHARMAIDNLALAGNVILEIDSGALEGDQDFSVHPGKIFVRTAGYQGKAINSVDIKSTTDENIAMFDKFRQLSDEQTGIPSYSHGQTNVTNTTRTAAGMSMLMGAAALNIKTIVKNLDDYLLEPLGRAFFYWNMQFNPDPKIKGDLDVKAKGTDAVMQKEVRSQRLITFMQVTGNSPATAPFVKWNQLIKEIAISLDLDPDEIVNSPDEAMIMSQIMGNAGGLGGNGRQMQTSETTKTPQGETGTGDGNIGTGKVPLPGEKEFSGSVG